MTVTATTTNGTARKLKPRAAVQQAKLELTQDKKGKGKTTSDHPVAELIRDHPVASVGLAAVAGFLIVTIKPGRLILRQTFLAGFGLLLRRALIKYITQSR